MVDHQNASFETMRPRLLRSCRGYLGQRQAEASDIVQDAFMAFAEGGGADASLEDSGERWRQRCLQLCGARMRSDEGEVRSLEAELELVRLRLGVEPVDSRNLAVRKQQSLDLLGEAIKPLSLPARQVLELRNVKGLSYAQVGGTLGLSWGEVSARLSKARLELAASVGPFSPPAPVGVAIRGPWPPLPS